MDILINKEDAGKTIKKILTLDLGYSARMIKKLKFSEGGILVNGQFKTVRYELKEGDILSLACEDTDDDTSPYITPIQLDIGIAYEDSHLTVIDKPPLMPAHPSLGHRDDTAANALAFRYSGQPYVFRPVNRLDRDTSGLMITANTRLAAYKLYKSMINGHISKAYIAILDGSIEKDSDMLISYMGRCTDSIIKRRICSENDPDAKIAVTAYRVLIRTEQHSVVLASPVTGRTHQLRLHFSSIGHPVCGDTMYGEYSELIPRHALHSAYTSFLHPDTNKSIHLLSPLPADMKNIIGEEVAIQLKDLLDQEIPLLMDQIENYEKI